jgi:hypothetical protein
MQTNKLLALKMTENHSFPITPPPELFAEWLAKAKRLHPAESTGFIAGEVARLAYRTGADQELEACCEWLEQKGFAFVDELRAARRPKPSSLKEQALQSVKRFELGQDLMGDLDTIRRALEQLDD